MKEKLLIIGFVWPEPRSSAAGSRMMQLISFFQRRDFDITFASACTTKENAVDLESFGITSVSIVLNDSSFDKFISELQPDVVVFDRFMIEEQYGWRVSESCPSAVKILDTEDLHFLRQARHKALKANAPVEDFLYTDATKREIASLFRCDLSLIISEAEMRLLQGTFGISDKLLCYLPFLIDSPSEAEQKALPDFNSRIHFISIGNFLHEPNFDALRYLKDELWSAIRNELPNAELHNYGAYASQKVEQLQNEKEGFFIKGFAEDVDEVMQSARVLLAPLRFGAGLKGKLFDAMRNGTPFVTTSIGGEGILDTDASHAICDSSQAFIKKAIHAYQDSDEWTRAQQMGFETLRTKFSKQNYELHLQERLEYLFQDLEKHRRQHFLGQVLQHHSLQSTKYMSKWIEEKQKNRSEDN